jgi:hypothetical protein
METGFLIDTVFPGNVTFERQGENLFWAKGSRSGVPRPNIFLRLIGDVGFLFSSVEKRPVTTLRCVNCGYLELYAQ